MVIVNRDWVNVLYNYQLQGRYDEIEKVQTASLF